MKESANYQNALGRLRELLTAFKPGSKVYEEIVAPRDQVLARYQPVFALGHLDALTPDEFKSFLYIENNRHWSGLNRKGGRACNNMAKLRNALRLLLDDSRSIAQRIEQATERASNDGRGEAFVDFCECFAPHMNRWFAPPLLRRDKAIRCLTALK